MEGSSEEPVTSREAGWPEATEEPEPEREPEEGSSEEPVTSREAAEEPEPEDQWEPREEVMEQDEFEEPDYMMEPDEELNEEEKELERTAGLYRRRMRRGKRVNLFYKDMALKYMDLNKHNEDDPFADPNAVYRQIEDSSVTIKRAFGNIVEFRMFLAKGDCENDRLSFKEFYFGRKSEHPYAKPTNCEKLDCVFTMFQDVRTHHDAIIDSDCQPLILAEERMWQPYEDDAMMYDDDYTNYVSDDDTPDVPASDGDTPDVPASGEDTPDSPISEDDTPDTPASHGDTPDAPTSDDDDAN